MIKLVDKQRIIIMHRDGESNRKIAAVLGIDDSDER